MKNIRRIILMIVFIIAILLFHIHCGPFSCIDLVDSSPEDLIKTNDYVMTARFILSNPLISLDTINVYGEDYHYYIMECAFQSLDMFKSNGIDSLFYLWYLGYTDLSDNSASGIIIRDSNIVLVYGNAISDNFKMTGVLRPEMGSSFKHLEMLLNNEIISYEIKKEWHSFERDSILTDLISNSDTLKALLAMRLDKGIVIHGTDPHFFTFDSFQRGTLAYCNKSKMSAHYTSSKEYLKELRRLAKK